MDKFQNCLESKIFQESTCAAMKRGSYLGSSLIVSEVSSVKFNDERTIEYTGGNRLEYHKQPEKTGYVFNYHCGERAIRLNDLVYDRENWDFYPADKFVMVIAEGGYVLDKPEIRLCTARGKNCPGLIDDEIAILAALHEIGHANLYASLRARFGQYSDNETYAQQLAATHNFFDRLFGKTEFERRSERYAWAFAFKTMRNLRIVEQFDIHDFRHFYIPLLGGHGQDFVNAKGRHNYATTLSPDDYFWRKRTEIRSWRKRNLMAAEDIMPDINNS